MLTLAANDHWRAASRVGRLSLIKLYVVDGKARRQFLTAPANVAAERDFNRIDMDGVEPDALEQAFSSFEGELSTALERITAAWSFRHEGDRAMLFNFIALLAVKNPRLRETFRDFHERVMHQVLDVATATPERWASQASRAKEAGYIDKDADTDYGAACSAVHKKTLRGRFRINAERSWRGVGWPGMA